SAAGSGAASVVGLALAFAAVHRAAAGQTGGLQGRPASQTGLPTAAVDEQLLLVAAAQPEGVDVIDDRRAARRNAVFQHLLDRGVERPPFTDGEAVRPPARTDSRPKTCLVGVDVADAGEKRLIQ